jgi:hypothetical protein
MSDCSPTAFLSSTRLPDDVIQEIFIWYVNDDPFVDVPFLPIVKEERCIPSPHWDLDDREDDNSEDDDDYSASFDEISPLEEE